MEIGQTVDCLTRGANLRKVMIEANDVYGNSVASLEDLGAY